MTGGEGFFLSDYEQVGVTQKFILAGSGSALEHNIE